MAKPVSPIEHQLAAVRAAAADIESAIAIPGVSERLGRAELSAQLRGLRSAADTLDWIRNFGGPPPALSRGHPAVELAMDALRQGVERLANFAPGVMSDPDLRAEATALLVEALAINLAGRAELSPDRLTRIRMMAESLLEHRAIVGLGEQTLERAPKRPAIAGAAA